MVIDKARKARRLAGPFLPALKCSVTKIGKSEFSLGNLPFCLQCRTINTTLWDFPQKGEGQANVKGKPTDF